MKSLWIGPIIIVIFAISFGVQSVCAQTLSERQFLLVEEIVPRGKVGEFTHGKFPSWGKNTHAGVDIIGVEGTPIRAWADGKVVDVIKEGHPDFRGADIPGIGYAVKIKHKDEILGKETYTLYLHLKEPPNLTPGQEVDKGEEIAKVGNTGARDTEPHLHFEIRHFPETYSTWGNTQTGNIYGFGDKSRDNYFVKNWEDPIYLPKQVDEIKNINLYKDLLGKEPTPKEIGNLLDQVKDLMMVKEYDLVRAINTIEENLQLHKQLLKEVEAAKNEFKKQQRKVIIYEELKEMLITIALDVGLTVVTGIKAPVFSLLWPKIAHAPSDIDASKQSLWTAQEQLTPVKVTFT